MKVLLIGITGNVGSRLLPALLAHKHQVVAYVRTPSKLSPEAISKLDSVVQGSATDSTAIKNALLTHNCDALVNAAGMAAMTSFSAQGDNPLIFEAVVKAALEAGQERGGAPIRSWFMSGLSILDSPKKPYFMVDYIPIFPIHKKNYLLINTKPVESLAWSLLCPSELAAKYDKPQFPAAPELTAENLVAKADSPAGWHDKYRQFPLIGTYLNILSQAASYGCTVENIVDFIAADLEKGIESPWVGKRVGVKEKSKMK